MLWTISLYRIWCGIPCCNVGNDVCIGLLTQVVTPSLILTFYWCFSKQFCMLVFPTEIKMWKLWVPEIHLHVSWLLTHEKDFLRWGLWTLFCNETSGSDIVKSQAHRLLELLKRFQPKHCSSLSMASKTELRYYWRSDENTPSTQNPVCMWWNHFKCSNYSFWKRINVIKYICCSKNHYYD